MPKQTFYITAAIDYTNGKPHLGHLYEKVIADALARWHKQLNEDVYFLAGTDEHGAKIEKTAKSKDKKPKQFVDELAVSFQELLKKLNVCNNDFIRTTELRHKKVAKQIFQEVFNKGLIYKGKYEGLYCVGCEAYFTEKDLVDGLCPVHQKAPEKLSEEAYFFKLSQFQSFLIKLYEEHPEFLQPESRRNEIVNRLKEGLKDLSVSRKTLKWGIKLPNDNEHVIYVWVEALVNYISALGYPDGKKFKKYWPAQVHIIGKDIVWFHAVIWPALLSALGLPLPKTIHSHGFVNIGGEKLSKSLGKTADPIALIDTYGTDALRYFLLREIPAGNDGDFSEEALVARTNPDLGDTLGNLLQRTSVLVHKNFSGQIPKPGRFTKEDKELIANADKVFTDANALMQKFEWHKAIERIWEFAHACNKYVNDQEPWNLVKQSLTKNLTTPAGVGQVIEDKERLGTVLYVTVESLRVLSVLTWPFIPETADKISCQLGQKLGNFKKAVFKRSTKGTLAQPQILFTKFEAAKPDAKPAEIEPFRKLRLRVAEITDVQAHPNADKLYVLKLNLGSEQRQIVAGMKPFYQPEELKGKHIVVVSNLKPANLRGQESQGMMLAAQIENTVKVLEAPNSEPGTDVFVEGIPCDHDQITIDDFAKVKITTKSGKAVYKDKPLKTDKEEVVVSIGDNATIR